MRKITIAIDGPSGAGKSSMAAALANQLGIMHLNTGAMYRALAVECCRRGVDVDNEELVSQILQGLTMDVRFEDGRQRTLVNGNDLSDDLYRNEISMAASTISKYEAVRKWLVERQQKLAESESFILDGRDIGTVVLPNADIKFFLTADAETRAGRRLLDLQNQGETISYEDVLADIVRRDEQDINRDISPLRQAEDAIFIDSGPLNREEVVHLMLQKLKDEKLIED